MASALIVLGALLGAPAPATAVVPADTRYGGGDVVDQPSGRAFIGRPGDTVATLRTIGTGRVQAAATVLHACRGRVAQALGRGTTNVAPDGAFSLRSRQRDGRFVDHVTIAGRIDGSRATGTVNVVTRLKRTRKRVCGGAGVFTSVTPPAPGQNPVAAPGGRVLVGALAVPSFSPYEVAFRVAGDGASIVRFVIATPYRCNGRKGAQIFYETGAAVAPDGTFRVVNPYTIRSRRFVERARTVIEGRFVDGGATGTVRVTSRTRARRGGRVVMRCTSGRRTWTAAL